MGPSASKALPTEPSSLLIPGALLTLFETHLPQEWLVEHQGLQMQQTGPEEASATLYQHKHQSHTLEHKMKGLQHDTDPYIETCLLPSLVSTHVPCKSLLPFKRDICLEVLK